MLDTGVVDQNVYLAQLGRNATSQRGNGLAIGQIQRVVTCGHAHGVQFGQLGLGGGGCGFAAVQGDGGAFAGQLPCNGPANAAGGTCDPCHAAGLGLARGGDHLSKSISMCTYWLIKRTLAQ